MQALSLKLPDNLFQTLLRTAQEAATTQSEIVRRALTEYLSRSADAQPTSQSFGDMVLSLGLVGVGHAADGTPLPTDLSTNPKHMEGFGK